MALDLASLERRLRETKAIGVCTKISLKHQVDNDYIVACKDGSRYRLFVNTEGRLVVRRQ